MAPSSPPASPVIKTLDFDVNRTARSHTPGHRSLLNDDVSLMSEVAEGIMARDREWIRAQFIRTCSFICAVLSWYAGLLPTPTSYGSKLWMTRASVNTVSTVYAQAQ